MRLAALALALALTSGVSMAATKHPKPAKAAKMVKAPKIAKAPKVAKRSTSRFAKSKVVKHPATHAAVKHKAPKVTKHKS